MKVKLAPFVCVRTYVCGTLPQEITSHSITIIFHYLFTFTAFHSRVHKRWNDFFVCVKSCVLTFICTVFFYDFEISSYKNFIFNGCQFSNKILITLSQKTKLRKIYAQIFIESIVFFFKTKKCKINFYEKKSQIFEKCLF